MDVCTNIKEFSEFRTEHVEYFSIIKNKNKKNPRQT